MYLETHASEMELFLHTHTHTDRRIYRFSFEATDSQTEMDG